MRPTLRQFIKAIDKGTVFFSDISEEKRKEWERYMDCEIELKTSESGGVIDIKIEIKPLAEQVRITI